MPVLILDRDGVINHDSADFIKSEEEWLPLTGSIEAIARASKAGWQIVVASNQSGLGRGLFDEFALARMHEKFRQLVEEAGGTIEGIFYCPHTPDAGCDCRKPKTGMLSAIEEALDVDLTQAPFVGDSLRDLQSALSFGCKPILVRTGKGAATEAQLKSEPTVLDPHTIAADEIAVFDDLAAVVSSLL